MSRFDGWCVVICPAVAVFGNVIERGSGWTDWLTDSAPSVVFCRSLSLSLFPSLVIRPHLVEFSKLALAFSLVASVGPALNFIYL